MRPAFQYEDGARLPTNPVAGAARTGRASWLPFWLVPYLLITLLSAALFAWLGSSPIAQPDRVERVQSALMRFKPALGDTETTAERRERLTTAAEAIVDAAGGDPAVEAALITIGWFESHWSQLIAEGRCADYRWKCDYDKRTGKPKSLSNLQLQRAACPELHDAEGPPDVAVAAHCAARLWRYGRARCGSDAGAFALYGTGSRCTMATAATRAEFMRRVLSAL